MQLVPWTGQDLEDKWVWENLFHGQRGGFFLEMGALVSGPGARAVGARWVGPCWAWLGVHIG